MKKVILDGNITLEKTKDSDLTLKHIQEIYSGKKIKISSAPIIFGKRINETAENPEISVEIESKFLRTQNPQIKSGKTIGQLRSRERRLFVVNLETGQYGNLNAMVISNGGVYLRASEFEKLASVQPASKTKPPSGFVPVLSLGQKILMKLNPIAVARRAWRSIYHPKIFVGRWVTVRGEDKGISYKVRVRINSLTTHGLDIIIGASTVEYV